MRSQHPLPFVLVVWAWTTSPIVAGEPDASPRRPARLALTPLDLRDVDVGGEIGRRIDVTVSNNLLVLDVEKDFLDPFRRRDRSSGYIGLGKLIDSLVRLAAHTGDQALLERKEHVVRETIETQETDGYIGLMKPEHRLWRLWDVHEMAYLVYGLTSDYELFGRKASLDAARKLADLIVRRWSAEPSGDPSEGSITLHMAVTGLEQALLSLHEATGDSRYLEFARDFRKLPEWEAPIVLGRWGKIGGHAYAHMCRCLAQLRLYDQDPMARLLEPTDRVMDFITAKDGMVITGAVSDHECWHDTQEGLVDLGETCATAYLLRLLDRRLRMTGDARYGDIMERVILNTLFAAQSPDGRRLRYYSPFDGPRRYFDGDTYCCPCNYRRIVAELPSFVYYRSRDGVAVNLYTESSATWTLEDGTKLALRQETRYPSDGRVVLYVDPEKPRELALQLRSPRWCDRPSLQVNGDPWAVSGKPGEIITIRRTWRPGDRLDLELPMPWRLVKGRKAQAGRVAVLRGPQVFCLRRDADPKLKDLDLRLLVIDPGTIEGPFPDDTVRPGGVACRVKAWRADSWYPAAKPQYELTLREFPDPEGEATYFKVPNPRDARLVPDELATPIVP